jgi:hypothetical protein
VKLFTTTDISASIHKASGQFTHVVFNRAYVLHKPVFFDSRPLLDLPLYQHMPWLDAEGRQFARWQETGGVLIEPGSVAHTCDVTVLVECPLTVARIEQVASVSAEGVVIPNPVSWTVYDEYLDLHRPVTEHLQEIWSACGGRRMTNGELSRASGWPLSQLVYMKAIFQPKEHWYIEKRLAPERQEFIPAWDWLEGGCVPRSEVTKAGFRAAVEEMARFGYIGLKKLQHYPAETPNWRKLAKEREQALRDLAAVRLLLESLPDHPST